MAEYSPIHRIPDRPGLIHHRPDQRVVTVHGDFYAICGEVYAAVILELLAKETRQAGEWIARSYEQLSEDTLGLVKPRNLPTAIATLMSHGFLKRDPEYVPLAGGVCRYQLQIATIQEALNQLTQPTQEQPNE